MGDEHGYAATAAKFLDAAATAESGELRDLVLRHLAVMQGIGWAVLAVHDQLAAATGAAGEVADQVGDLAVPAERLADAAQSRARPPWRSRRVREPEPRRCLMCRATEADAELEWAGSGSWRCVQSGDCYWRDRARRGPGAVVVPASAAQTVRRALADAITLRSADGGCGSGGDCPDDQCPEHGHDAGLAGEYMSLLARLGGDLR